MNSDCCMNTSVFRLTCSDRTVVEGKQNCVPSGERPAKCVYWGLFCSLPGADTSKEQVLRTLLQFSTLTVRKWIFIICLSSLLVGQESNRKNIIGNRMKPAKCLPVLDAVIYWSYIFRGISEFRLSLLYWMNFFYYVCL